MVPRNTRHAFRVDSETARFLNGYTPASLEGVPGGVRDAGNRTRSPAEGCFPHYQDDS